MKTLNLTTATKRYNSLMIELCYEHNTIGTRLSENTDNWNLRDMVAECDYVLSTYHEDGHTNYELKEENPKQWRSETDKLKRFIKAYEPFIDDMVCTEGHCSNYD